MKERVPEIRFNGFEGPWKKRKLGEVGGTFQYGLNASAIQYDGKHKYIRITDIDDDSRQFSYNDLSSPNANASELLDYKLWVNDIVFARTGASVGKTYRYNTDDGDVFFAGFLIRTNINVNYDAEFVFQNTLTYSYNKFIRETSQRSGQPGVNAKEYAEYAFMCPSFAEQKEIGCFFKNIDRQILLQQQKLDKLKTLKKSCLEKMFPKDGETVPEIRFNGFEGPWEKRKLSDLATMHARIGWQNLRTSEFMDNGDYLLITGTDFMDGRIDFSSCHYVKKERYEQDRNIQIGNGNILITKDGTLGKVAFVQGLPKPATLNAGVFNVTVKDETLVSNKYMFQYLKAPFLMDYVNKRATGGTIKHLNQNLLVDFPVVIPSKEEQEMIGLYLNNLDTLITLQQQKLDKLKNLKKALLNKIFVYKEM